MSNKQETIEDIVADIRAQNQGLPEDNYALSPLVCDLLSFADRIEAAARREREAGAEAAQICGEIGEIIGREATTEKSSRVGNANAVRGIAQEMLNTSMQEITAESINGWAMRLAEACEQPVTNCNQLGNAAAMRKALSDACYAMFNFLKTQNGGYEEMTEALDKAKSVLSTPPRNCDVGTAEEQSERYEKFCYAHRSREKGCGDCPLCDIVCCGFAWLQMPYEEVGAK